MYFQIEKILFELDDTVIQFIRTQFNLSTVSASLQPQNTTNHI